MKKSLFLFAALAFAFGACQPKADQNSDTKDYNKQTAPGVQAQFQAAQTRAADSVVSVARARNVILLIGDGMGVSQVYAGFTQNKGQLNLEQFRHIGFSKTYSADAYITDSAAGATAFSIGQKTYNGAIGVDTAKVAHPTILEQAEQRGLATGLVAVSAITHATPASFIAHQPSRKMGEEIAADFLRTDIDVFIGGGIDHFAKRADKQNLIDTLRQRGYTIAHKLEEVAAHTTGRLAGLLYAEHPPTFADGRGDMLGTATIKAIELLSKNTNGFFLMAEASQIDWGGHDNNGQYLANEMVDFDNTIGRVLDWARRDGNTLVIVTADHETGGCALNGGDLATGTLKAAFTSKAHTAVMVPVFAFGPGAEAFQGIYENTDIYHKMRAALGLDQPVPPAR